MHQIEVDERDSSWEIDEARFRVYVFMGAANAVATTDVLSATVEEALEAARNLAEGDRHLWSIALAHDDGAMDRGLVWLSGNDYNDYPRADSDTAAYWRHRGTMQGRYLLARAHAGEPVVLPTGERSIRLDPEWGADLPLWEQFTDHYPVKRGALPLGGRLEGSLAAWNQRWQILADPDTGRDASETDWAAWRAKGVELVARLREALVGVAEVHPAYLHTGIEA